MSSKRFALLLLLCGALPLSAAPPKKTVKTVPSDGTVTGDLTINGTKYPLTHIYGRKREAWPADEKALRVSDGDGLPCGVVELILVNGALPEETIPSILQNDYHGSDKVRGIRRALQPARVPRRLSHQDLQTTSTPISGRG